LVQCGRFLTRIAGCKLAGRIPQTLLGSLEINNGLLNGHPRGTRMSKTLEFPIAYIPKGNSHLIKGTLVHRYSDTL
jgi:hypothetical protein